MESPQQTAVILQFAAYVCLSVTACAGAGKTTTSIKAAAKAPGRTLMLVYNKQLKADTEVAIAKSDHPEKLSVFTIHAAVGRLLGVARENDTQLRNNIHALKSGARKPKLFEHYDHLIVDETQDLCPLYRDAIVEFVKHTQGTVHLMFVGDPKQILYDYRTETMKSSTRYLIRPDLHFAEIAPQGSATEWSFLKLSVSYRLTAKAVRLLNLVLGCAIVAGNTSSPDLPVSYIIANSYVQSNKKRSGSFLLSDVTGLVDKYGAEHVMILGHSIRTPDTPPGDVKVAGTPPVPHLINQLVEITGADGRRRVYVYVGTSEYAGNAACSRGKVRFLTYCGSKGSEAKCVIVIGGTGIHNVDRVVSREQLGVALSRHLEKLVIIHGTAATPNGGPAPHMYYPLPGDDPSEASSERMRLELQKLADEGCIHLQDRTRQYADGARHTFPKYRPPKTRPNTHVPRPVIVTERDELDPAIKQALCSMFTWTTPAPMHANVEHVTFADVSHTNPHARYGPEDIANLTGMAIPYAVEMHTHGGISDVHTVLAKHNAKLADAKARGFYKSDKPSTHDKIVGMILKSYAKLKSARARRIHAKRTDWLPTRAEVVDFYAIAAGVDALSSYVAKLIQLGADLDAHPAFGDPKWIDDAAFRRALRNVDISLFRGGAFEVVCGYKLTEAYDTLDDAPVDSIVGRPDWATTQDDELDEAQRSAEETSARRFDMTEIKTTNALTDDHRLQTGTYACMLVIILQRPVRAALINTRTGELTSTLMESVEQATRFLECYTRCKRPPLVPHPVFTVLPSPPGEVVESAEDAPTGGRRPKRKRTSIRDAVEEEEEEALMELMIDEGGGEGGDEDDDVDEAWVAQLQHVCIDESEE